MIFLKRDLLRRSPGVGGPVPGLDGREGAARAAGGGAGARGGEQPDGGLENGDPW